MQMSCQQIFSVQTKCDASVYLKFTQQMKFKAHFVTLEKDEIPVETFHIFHTIRRT